MFSGSHTGRGQIKGSQFRVGDVKGLRYKNIYLVSYLQVKHNV